MRVTGVHLTVDPNERNYRGACPVRMIFNGSITTDGKGSVGYTFESSDGRGWSGGRLNFSGPGTRNVQQVWVIRNSYSGWLALKPRPPYTYVSSTRAFFKVTCTGHLQR